MLVNVALTVLATSCTVALAAPAGGVKNVDSSLRLIKTSETDAGIWVTEQEKFDKYTSKGIGFFDITDIQDEEVLSILSTPEDQLVSRRAVTYPAAVAHVDEANKLIANVNNAGPQSWLKTFTEFHTRHYRSATGTQASAWLFDQVSKIGAANPAITVNRFTHSYNQPSIIAQIPGEKPDLVIVGAHMDSTAGSSTARSPGADDNGSGSVTILEAFRVLAESGFKPKNTIEFHWYSGEEGGLLGSQGVFSKYKADSKNVLAMLNQDMTGFSPSDKIAVYTDFVDAALSKYVTTIITAYTGTAPNTSRCGYGCSDHASARSNGFPSAFAMEDVFEKTSKDIHSSRDSLEKIMWPSILRHSKFTVAFLVEASYI